LEIYCSLQQWNNYANRSIIRVAPFFDSRCIFGVGGHLPAPIVNGEGDNLEKCNFRNFRSPVTLTWTLDRVIRHIIVHQSWTSVYVPNFTEIGKTICGRTDMRTYGRTYVRTYWRTFQPPSNVIRSTRRSRPKNALKCVDFWRYRQNFVGSFLMIHGVYSKTVYGYDVKWNNDMTVAERRYNTQ